MTVYFQIKYVFRLEIIIMLERFPVTVPLPNGKKEERMAYIYLPDNYYKNRWKRYPVLYMFDGHNVFVDEDASFGKSWGMKNFMDRTRTPMIIAAVECNHDPDNGRLKEYSPYTFEDPKYGLIKGRGRTTMNWFVNYFKRNVDRNYRTLSDRGHTFIAGSSMGGLMSLYALLEYNHVFSRAAALSPSLWTAPDKLAEMIEHADVAPDTVLYMDYGSEEFGNHEDMYNDFCELSSMLMRKGIMINLRIVPGGSHCEACWEEQVPFFMRTLLYNMPKPARRGR